MLKTQAKPTGDLRPEDADDGGSAGGGGTGEVVGERGLRRYLLILRLTARGF